MWKMETKWVPRKGFKKNVYRMKNRSNKVSIFTDHMNSTEFSVHFSLP